LAQPLIGTRPIAPISKPSCGNSFNLKDLERPAAEGAA
jgi:hypothetical protein